MLKKLFLLTFLFESLFGLSQIPSISESTKFSIITVDVSNEVHTLYGHTALRVKDLTTNIDVVYNYGMFDFRTENFLLKFVKGDLQYYAAVYPYRDFEYSYKEENRSYYEQELNLSLSEKQELFNKLNNSVFTEDRFYTYKFIDRNCTTKVIDIVNSVLKNNPIKNTLHKEESYRDILFDYQKNHFYLNLGINIIFGHRPDEQASVLFLPLDLMEVLKNTKYQGKLLAEKPINSFIASKVEEPFHFFDNIYSLIAILSVFVIINKRWSNVIYFTLFGLIGMFFCLVGFYSLHREVLWNYNVLLFSPLYLGLVYFLIKNNTIWIKKISLISLLLIGCYVLYMFNKAHLIIVMPIILTTSILLFRLYTKK